jgi:D-arginine dehydrogenase
MVPVLRAKQLLGAIYEPDAADIDVHALHQGYLRDMRRAGGSLVCSADVSAIERIGAEWRVQAGEVAYQAPVLLNAAGAWVDMIARLAGATPIGIEPRRRSAFTFTPPDGVDVSPWPLVLGADEDWYLKPDAGQLLGSPANADPVEPHDVRAEEFDIALAIHRIEEVTTLAIRRPTHTWQGCARSSPMAIWSVASTTRHPVSSGSPRRAATASRPLRRWARAVPHSLVASRCPRASRTSASLPR